MTEIWLFSPLISPKVCRLFVAVECFVRLKLDFFKCRMTLASRLLSRPKAFLLPWWQVVSQCLVGGSISHRSPGPVTADWRGRKTERWFTHNPVLGLTDDLSGLCILQVRRAETPRLCRDDGQVRDLCVHLSHRIGGPPSCDVLAKSVQQEVVLCWSTDPRL